MEANSFEYSGVEVLEAMSEAANYNAYLLGLVLDLVPGVDAQVLDFGAGLGTYADMLVKRGLTPDCVEPDDRLQRSLRKKGYATVASAADLDESSYDLIYSLNVFEHIEDDYAAFRSLVRALKAGGALLIYVPAFPGLYSSFDDLVGHFRRYRRKRLRSMATENGMTVTRLAYCDPIGYLAALAFKALRSESGGINAAQVRFYDRFAFPLSKALEPAFANLVGKNAVLIAKKPLA